jgi:hypothetical protein
MMATLPFLGAGIPKESCPRAGLYRILVSTMQLTCPIESGG